MALKLKSKHFIYLALAIFPNILLLLVIVFRKELVEDLDEAGVVTMGFFLQTISAIITIFGGSFMIKAYRKSSSFYYWLGVTFLAFIPVIYYTFF